MFVGFTVKKKILFLFDSILFFYFSSILNICFPYGRHKGKNCIITLLIYHSKINPLPIASGDRLQPLQQMGQLEQVQLLKQTGLAEQRGRNATFAFY